jgi:pimeloyl-ACP methyl ester carboxylesterase
MTVVKLAMRETPEMSTPETRRGTVTVDGKGLEFLSISGQSSVGTIAMLHEGLGSVGMWKQFPTKLAELTGWSVVAYSRYGHGKSAQLQEPRTVRYMHHEAEVVLPGFLNHLGIERPVLLGHSDGGSIALIFAGTFPLRTRALILEAPHVFTEDIGLASIAKAGASYRTNRLQEKLSRYHDDADSTFWGWNRIWLDPEFRAWNIERYLSRIACPILILQGEQDEYGTVAQLEAIQRGTHDAEIVLLPKCGHAPHRDQEQQTLDSIVKFISRLGG